jgi:hypothetical protein
VNTAAALTVGDRRLADRARSFLIPLLETAVESDPIIVAFSIADSAYLNRPMGSLRAPTAVPRRLLVAGKQQRVAIAYRNVATITRDLTSVQQER